MRVPPGSMWRVKPFVSPSIVAMHRRDGLEVPDTFYTVVNALEEPVSLTKSWDRYVRAVKLSAGDMLVVADTVPDEGGNPYCHFVRVLLPRPCYVNRTHFNSGSSYLERVA